MDFRISTVYFGLNICLLHVKYLFLILPVADLKLFSQTKSSFCCTCGRYKAIIAYQTGNTPSAFYDDRKDVEMSENEEKNPVD